MGGGPISTRDSDDLVQVLTTSVQEVAITGNSSADKAHLLLAKSHVFVHPSTKSKDHISGYLGIAEVAKEDDRLGGEGKKGVVVFWIPASLAEVLDEEGKYEAVSERSFAKAAPDAAAETSESEKDDYVFVTLPSAAGAGNLPSSSTASLFSASSGASPAATADAPDELELAFTEPDAARQAKVDRERQYAWSVPIEDLYSILVYPPSMSSWYGSITINLLGGLSLPTLYFHDDESASTIHLMSTGGTLPNQPLSTGTATPAPPTSSSSAPAPRRIIWGATSFFACLRDHCDLLRSRLEPRLFLINPSKPDREVHEIDLGDDRENDRVVPKPMDKTKSAVQQGVNIAGVPYPPRAKFPTNPSAVLAHGIASSGSSSSNDLPQAFSLHPARTQLLSSFSQLTQKAKQITQQVLSQPFAEPIVPHLPQNMRKMVDPSREWESKARRRALFGEDRSDATGGGSASVTGEFESARVYLARWARVVAEEGERSRKRELAGTASLSATRGGAVDARSDLGIFEVVRSARGDASAPPPSTTRTHGNPVTRAELIEWHGKGLDESYLRGEVFRRGLDETDDTRKLVWEVLLGVIPWSVGLGNPGSEAETERAALRSEKKQKYEELKRQWQDDTSVHVQRDGDDHEAASGSGAHGAAFTDKQREEWHRIDVDCRRTDRNQPMFAVPDNLAGQEEKEGGGAGAQKSPTVARFEEAEEGSQTALNPHTAALRTILMTYHQYSPTLGYVQGMSDLLSPIYVVYEADEASSFWAFVGWMKYTVYQEVNFLRDQSGMKNKLGTLQKLISVMDPELYRKLERTHSTSLFMCFRWLLIAFKREFKFDDVIRLWDILFTDYYTNEFVIFVALAILHSHREVIIRYLVEFDEVLKYANDLSETIDLESTLAQAEVLFLSFRSLVEEVDRNEIIRVGMINAAIAEEERREEEIAVADATGSSGLRRRRGSHSSAKSGKSVREEEKRELVPDELRELLISFKDRS
ncbi:hypothetical protein QFC21_004348 [Naganishia friedmannii]|uniref:Uncharacterized protein n=1 Tax=Naganishia friedmannii TaxID=89922 RepID=A0ACC2VII2_9TREE|nr:hypothetical protein QFC21_004348 [Naganishia friedmannii]